MRQVCVKEILHDNSSDRLHALPKIDITMQIGHVTHSLTPQL